MRWLNPYFTQKPMHVLGQCFTFVIFMAVVIILMDKSKEFDMIDAIGIASMSASTGLVCISPRAKMARPLNILIGYAIGISSGLIWHLLTPYICHAGLSLNLARSYEFCSVFAIATAMFAMAITGFAHVPAIGFCIGIVIEYWNFGTISVIALAAICLSLLRLALDEKLIDIID